jgi:hypothetical protein
MESLQNRHAPASRCFGCGPASEKGLRIESFVAHSGEEVVAVVVAREGHPAFHRW